MKRILCVLLASLMLLPLAACGTNDEEGTDTLPPKDNEIVEEGETTDPNYTCDLPDNLDFENTEVNIMYVNVDGRKDELYSAKLGNGGSILDAVYERNLTVENQLGVKLGFVEESDDGAAASKVRSLVSAGDRSVDIFTMASYLAVADAITGIYLDLNRVEYVDTSKHYWSQDYNTVTTFTSSNMQFLATSPAALSMFRLAYLTIFNADLMKERSMPNLYDVVDNGEWTLDYQYSLTNDVWVDTDGDGSRSEEDFYGHISGDTITVDTYPTACNIHVIIRDENGEWSFNPDELQNTVTMAEKVSRLLNSAGTYKYKGSINDSVGVNSIIKKFSNESGLMATVQFLSIEMSIESLADLAYGIVPMPKLSVEQKNYHTYVQDQVTAFGISAAIGDEDRQAVVGAVMEAIAYYSNEIVRPAYYDSSLSLRFMQDPRSRDMLDIMFETVSFDYGYLHPGGLGGVKSDMRSLLPSTNPNAASRFKVWQKSIKNELKKEQSILDRLSQN